MVVNNFNRAFVGVQRAFPGRRPFSHTNVIFPPANHSEIYNKIKQGLYSQFIAVNIRKSKYKQNSANLQSSIITDHGDLFKWRSGEFFQLEFLIKFWNALTMTPGGSIIYCQLVGVGG